MIKNVENCRRSININQTYVFDIIIIFYKKIDYNLIIKYYYITLISLLYDTRINFFIFLNLNYILLAFHNDFKFINIYINNIYIIN